LFFLTVPNAVINYHNPKSNIMKVLSINRIVLATIALSLILFNFSCKKEDTQKNPAVTEAEATEYSTESMEAEASYDDVQDVSMTAADEEGLISAGKPAGNTAGRPFPFLKLRLRIGAKAVITVTPDDNTYPKTVTIDFGDGETCPDGRHTGSLNPWLQERATASHMGTDGCSISSTTIPFSDSMKASFNRLPGRIPSTLSAWQG
jgi:hypothetical protein